MYNLQVTFEGTNPRYTASKSVCPISCDLYLNTIVVSCITVELHLISAISLSLSNTHTHTCTHTHTHAHTHARTHTCTHARTHARTHILSLSLFLSEKKETQFLSSWWHFGSTYIDGVSVLGTVPQHPLTQNDCQWSSQTVAHTLQWAGLTTSKNKANTSELSTQVCSS